MNPHIPLVLIQQKPLRSWTNGKPNSTAIDRCSPGVRVFPVSAVSYACPAAGAAPLPTELTGVPLVPCQGTRGSPHGSAMTSPQGRPREFSADGHFAPRDGHDRSPRSVIIKRGASPLPGHGVGEANAVAVGHEHVGVVHERVDQGDSAVSADSGKRPTSLTITRSARKTGVNALAIESSTRWRRTRVPRPDPRCRTTPPAGRRRRHAGRGPRTGGTCRCRPLQGPQGLLG